MINFLILLLLLYGAISVGLLWWCRLSRVAVIGCGFVGLVVGYFVFTHNVDAVLDFVFPFDPEEAFSSVEYIMERVSIESHVRYFFWNCGWVIGFAYFGLLWAISNALPRRATDKAMQG